MEKREFHNRLTGELSPYLLQHAENPVDWYPWGDEAFKKARDEEKPIFLSIGYSTCHWCHVMAHESFEDPEIGAMMNEVFVSIKVDREERPDIDGVYMTVSQMLTGGGGWPLTVIMTPDKKPFYSATYIPDKTRGSMIGMTDFIPMIQEAWKDRREELVNSAERIISQVSKRTAIVSGETPSADIVEKVFYELENRFDEEYGGFYSAPKFPTPHYLLFLLRFWKGTGNEKSLKMVTDTLNSMRKGGIYDHPGGGFHRYATDREWKVPHFEKMLYDQAMIASAYIEAYQVTGDPLYKNTVKGILDYVLRDMTSPGGGFFSAEDADSEGVEGKFYIWSRDELEFCLAPDEMTLVSEVFPVTDAGNYRDEATGRFTGQNILYSEDKELLENEKLHPVVKKLFEIRKNRIHPSRDDKILSDWNGMMISAMAKAGRIFNDSVYTEAAERAGLFIIREMKKDDGSLLHRYRDGEKGIGGYLEDYVFCALGFISLYEATFNEMYLRTALELADYTDVHFRDRENHGFFSVSDNDESFLFREKGGYDGALPSGNSAAMELFLILGRMSGRTDLISTAENTARAFSGQMVKIPGGFVNFASVLSMYHGIPREVIITGEEGDPAVMEMLDVLREGYYPNTVFIFVPSGPDGDGIRRMIPFLESYVPVNGRAAAYVCSNYRCKLPTTDPGVMRNLLK